MLDPNGQPPRGRPGRKVWIKLIRESVEYARSFAGHLLDVEPGKREAHVRSQVHTAEMLDVARYLEWMNGRVRDYDGRVSDELACEVMERLVGRDDFPVRMAHVLGQEPPEPNPYLPADWIRGVLETEASQASPR